MYTSEAALAVVEDATASGHIRGFLRLDRQAVVRLPALRDVAGGSATQNYIEYDITRHLYVELKVKPGMQFGKLQVQLYKADFAASTFGFNGQAY
ncbi:hypothetical protein WJX77_005101 [Trebouxia sp. C0004]